LDQEQEERELANRLSSYGDAVAAVSFVNALAFFIAVADQEVRCSLVDLRGFVAVCGVALQAAYLGAILSFRRAELRLRDSSGFESRPLVGLYRGRLHLARVVFVLVVTFSFIIVAWYGLSDPSCGG
jgi:hypothetical protein